MWLGTGKVVIRKNVPISTSEERLVTSRSLKAAIHRAFSLAGYRLIRIPRETSGVVQKVTRLWRSDDVIVQVAKANLNACPPHSGLPSLGERWGAYASRLRKKVSAISSAREMLDLGQSPDAGVETHLDPVSLKQLCRIVEVDLQSSLAPELWKSYPTFCAPPSSKYAIEHNGQLIDFVSLYAAQAILYILNNTDVKPRIICDIGGGTGKYSYAWMTNSAHNPDLFVIVDMPETLIYSESLLKNDTKYEIQYVDTKDKKLIEKGIILCPIQNIGVLSSVDFDLVTNTGSMQEMSDEWITFYMEFIENHRFSLFYSNNFFGNPLDSMFEGHNSWSPRPAPSWKVVAARLQVSARNAAEVLYARRSDTPEPKITGAPSLFEEWFRQTDRARLENTPSVLREVLGFASTMPFVPKEAWQIALELSQATGAPADIAAFEKLDEIRRSGTEALH